MNFYLDTGVIRSHSKKLALIPDEINVKTSCLAVMEIITGIPSDCNDIDKCEREFRYRRSGLKYLLDSNVFIDETWVDEAIDQAFKCSNNSQDSLYFSSAVKKLSALIVQSSSYRAFMSELDRLGFQKRFNDLQDFDKHTSECFASTSYQEIKNTLTHPNTNNFPSEKCPESLSDLANYLNSNEGFNLNYWMSLYSLCGRVNKGEPTPEVYNSYNFDLDIFLYVWSISCIQAMAKQNKYGRNDGIDILHLIYVKNGDTFITDDKTIRGRAKLANKIQGVSIRAISSEEFFNELQL